MALALRLAAQGAAVSGIAGWPAVGATARASARMSTPIDRWLLGRLQAVAGAAPVRFELWDGTTAARPAGAPVAMIRFRTREALLATLWDPELQFGEAYMAGTADVRGDLEAALEAIYRGLTRRRHNWWPARRANDRDASRANVHHHYDLGNAFYRLWLDPEMVYTCGYFRSPATPLDDAQVAKMELVCRKLHLRPGERVIEAGCGWGSLALYMARRYRVTVRAFNLSVEQIAYARERARAEGLGTRVEFVHDDYRNAAGRCDAFVSIGMLEHVGTHDYPTLGRLLDTTLAPDGRGLLHFIGRNRPEPLNAWIRRRVFPGAYAPTLPEVFDRALAPHDFSVLDVENLRLHYAKTLEHWRRRYLAAIRDVERMFDPAFARAWDLYLAGSQAAFVTGSLQLFQIVFTRGANNAIPWTRTTR
jgi:cyclopropane-fatty-acyl-phospholipid synthase